MDQEISKSFSISGRNSWFSVCLTTVVRAVLPGDIEWYRGLSVTDRRWSKSTTNIIEIPPNSKSGSIFIRRERLSLQPNKCFPITKASSIINDLTWATSQTKSSLSVHDSFYLFEIISRVSVNLVIPKYKETKQ